MAQKTRIATIPTSSGDIRINYIDVPAKDSEKGIILLIHGFPQTSYQYQHVIAPFPTAGFRLIIPDYRGAGRSSKPAYGPGQYTKSSMAADLHHLITHESQRNIR